MIDDARERFLRDIAERLPPDRIEEVHLFPPIRQGGKESGLAVIAVRPEEAGNGTEEAAADGAVPEAGDPAASSQQPSAGPASPNRFTVFRARYRWTRKGPERGKWEVEIVEEADAPGSAVDEVVRGVHERAGGGGDDAPERLTGDAFRAFLGEASWTATP